MKNNTDLENTVKNEHLCDDINVLDLDVEF